jgi:hypothetical protein
MRNDFVNTIANFAEEDVNFIVVQIIIKVIVVIREGKASTT